MMVFKKVSPHFQNCAGALCVLCTGVNTAGRVLEAEWWGMGGGLTGADSCHQPEVSRDTAVGRVWEPDQVMPMPATRSTPPKVSVPQLDPGTHCRHRCLERKAASCRAAVKGNRNLASHPPGPLSPGLHPHPAATKS